MKTTTPIETHENNPKKPTTLIPTQPRTVQAHTESAHTENARQLKRASQFGHHLEGFSIQPDTVSSNETGMPDQLRAGIENVSGISMDDVKVHLNSPRPAEVEALAYTQGAEIHIAPGQEKHLPHEAWHVVQQKQGRVKPTIQVSQHEVNDELELESEAEVMATNVQNNLPQRTRTLQRLALHNVMQRHCRDRSKHIMPASIPSTCHEYILWRLISEDVGYGDKNARELLIYLRMYHANEGVSIDSSWYGSEIIRNATPVDSRSVRDAAVGDILVTPNAQNPMHSMFIHSQKTAGTFVRGFNNKQTLGTGNYLEDDPTPRNIHGPTPKEWQNVGVNSYWKADGSFRVPLFVADRHSVVTHLKIALGSITGKTLKD